MQLLFTERETMNFIVRKEGYAVMTVTHPYRGTMVVQVDAHGWLVELDAGRTTRALVVERVPELDVANAAARFVAGEQAGNPQL